MQSLGVQRCRGHRGAENEGEQRGAESAELRDAESSGVQRCRVNECKWVKGCRA